MIKLAKTFTQVFGDALSYRITELKGDDSHRPFSYEAELPS